MESGTFLNDDIQAEFGRFVEIVLHTDGKDEKYGASSQENKILQKQRFGTLALPFYAVLDSSGEKVLWTGSGVLNAGEFLRGLRTAKSPE